MNLGVFVRFNECLGVDVPHVGWPTPTRSRVLHDLSTGAAMVAVTPILAESASSAASSSSASQDAPFLPDLFNPAQLSGDRSNSQVRQRPQRLMSCAIFSAICERCTTAA